MELNTATASVSVKIVVGVKLITFVMNREQSLGILYWKCRILY